jgi:hypothetical protein
MEFPDAWFMELWIARSAESVIEIADRQICLLTPRGNYHTYWSVCWFAKRPIPGQDFCYQCLFSLCECSILHPEF